MNRESLSETKLEITALILWIIAIVNFATPMKIGYLGLSLGLLLSSPFMVNQAKRDFYSNLPLGNVLEISSVAAICGFILPILCIIGVITKII